MTGQNAHQDIEITEFPQLRGCTLCPRPGGQSDLRRERAGQDQPARGGGGLLDHAAVPHGAEEGRTAVRRGCGIHLLGIRGAGPREHTRAAPVAPQGDGDLQKRRAPEAAERRAGPAQDRAVLSGGSDARARRRGGAAALSRHGAVSAAAELRALSGGIQPSARAQDAHPARQRRKTVSAVDVGGLFAAHGAHRRADHPLPRVLLPQAARGGGSGLFRYRAA